MLSIRVKSGTPQAFKTTFNVIFTLNCHTESLTWEDSSASTLANELLLLETILTLNSGVLGWGSLNMQYFCFVLTETARLSVH